MANTSQINRSQEMIDIAANMLFPLQRIDERPTDNRNLHTESQRRTREEVRDKAIALNNKHERDRWAYKTDIYIERLNLQLQQHPTLTQVLSVIEDEVLTNSEDEVLTNSELELRPTKIDSNISHPVMTWPEDLFRMLERAPATVREDAIENSYYGMAAGLMLRYLYHLARLQREPSLTKGRELFLEYHRSEYGRGRPKKGEKRHTSYTDLSLSVMWREYSSVAHQWAAFLTLRNDIIRPTDKPLENLDSAEFLRIAAKFAKFGASCTNKHASDWRLLPDDSKSSSLQSAAVSPKIDLSLINEKLEDDILKLEKKKKDEATKAKAAEEAASRSRQLE